LHRGRAFRLSETGDVLTDACVFYVFFLGCNPAAVTIVDKYLGGGVALELPELYLSCINHYELSNAISNYLKLSHKSGSDKEVTKS
jgi:hypothetical protein